MDCVRCHYDGGYNRVVVDLASGLELGEFCVNCEHDQFGALSDELGSPDRTTCLYCQREGLWALLKWRNSTRVTDRAIISSVEYDPSMARLRLCDEHLAKIGVDQFPAPVGVEDRHEYTITIVDE